MPLPFDATISYIKFIGEIIGLDEACRQWGVGYREKRYVVNWIDLNYSEPERSALWREFAQALADGRLQSDLEPDMVRDHICRFGFSAHFSWYRPGFRLPGSDQPSPGAASP